MTEITVSKTSKTRNNKFPAVKLRIFASDDNIQIGILIGKSI